MAKKIIQVMVDWGRAFVDPNGSFYCGTTDEQKDIAVKIISGGDLWLFLSDVHSRRSSEFQVNGGSYQTHNLVKRDWYDLELLGVAEGKTVSPELTDPLNDIVKSLPSGLIVPRHVFLQDYDGESLNKITPAFSFEDVENTFGARRLVPVEFLDGKIKYVINAKHFFNGAGLQSTEWMGNIPGIPTIEMNAFTLIKEMYGKGRDIDFNLTGVVMGICMYQTGSGIKQIFPNANVNIIADGATHLLVPSLGFSNEREANSALQAMCKQVGVNYITSREYLGK